MRWKEAVWVEKGKRKNKLIKVGERRVPANGDGTSRKSQRTMPVFSVYVAE